jgi:hypothetical protein
MKPAATTWKPDGVVSTQAYFSPEREVGPARFSDTEGYNRDGRAEYELENETENEEGVEHAYQPATTGRH